MEPQHDMKGFSKDPLILSMVMLNENSEGKANGEGVACYVGGHMYKGMFFKGLMDGHGVFTWAGGLKYEGNFVSNVMVGPGHYCWPDGSTYSGEIQNGTRHGTGSYNCGRKNVLYKGQWHHGKRHGKGAIYYNCDKTSWYKGDWVMNKIEGFGVRRYLSGNSYEGDWLNNLRHGQGKMHWVLQGQQYEGTWHAGAQHGKGKHTWIIKREDASRYSQSNQYIGDFVYGQRHGKGTFYYADGGKYEGEWRNNKKHGKGTFTFQNGKAFQCEFADDQMQHLRNDRLLSLLAFDSPSLLRPDMTLNIDVLLNSFCEKRRSAELKEVELVVLRHSSALRSIYNFYSRLGHAPSPDNTFMLSRMQLWRLLKDCKVHHLVSLSQLDLVTTGILDGATLTEYVHSPFTRILFCKLLSCLVVVAHHIYHKDIDSPRDFLAACFSKLMTVNILPKAKIVKGFLFKQQKQTEFAMRYCRKSWEVYQAYCSPQASPRDDKTMIYRDVLWMFKDFQLFGNIITLPKFMKVISQESADPMNTSSLLNQEITFLEFFDALLGCVEVAHWQQDEMDEVKNKESQISSKNRLLLPKMVDVSLDEINFFNNESLQLTESEEEGEQSKSTKEHRTAWEQKVHHFFHQVFFNAFELHQYVKNTIVTSQKTNNKSKWKVS